MHYPSETPRWRRYLRFFRPDVHGDVDEELRFHFESRIEELIAQGMSPPDARERAVQEFGDVTSVRQGLVAIDNRLARRRSRSEQIFEILNDVRYATRSLRRTPGVALAILATLALGVGANAAMFTLLDSIFLRPPAGVINPAGVRRVWAERHYMSGTQFSQILSYVQFDAIRTALGDRANVAVYRIALQTRVGLGENTGQAQVGYASAEYFSLLDVRASLGRLYSHDEDRLDAPSPVVVLSRAYWERAFDADPNAIGKSIILGGTKYTIVGVATKSFAGTELNATDIWAPLAFYARGRGPGTPWWRNPAVNGLFMLVRPTAGANDRELEQRITTALRRSSVGSDSLTVGRFGSIVTSNGPGKKGQEEQIAVRLTGVATIVLIIACANVVNLLLARAVRRRREIAVRLALGIARGRLIRLLLAESAVLTVFAVAIAIAVAYWGGVLLRKLLLPDIHWAQSPLDWRVVLFALVAAIGSGLIAGLIPALQSANPELTSALKIGTGSGVVQHSRLRASLVVVQSALSLLLLAGALLFVRSLDNVRRLDIGFDAKSLVTASVRFDDRTRASDSTLPRRMTELAERLRHVNGIERVGLMSMPPMSGFSTLSWYTDTDSSGAHRGFLMTASGISGEFFAAAGLSVLRGEIFSVTRGAPIPPSVVISESMAKTVWPGRNAIGQCIRFGSPTDTCYRVIGIVENARMGEIIERESIAQYYLPLDNLPTTAKRTLTAAYVAIRVAPERYARVSNEVRSLVRQHFVGGIPVLTRLSDYIDPQYRPWRLGAMLFTVFGILALVVAVIGIYSTVSYGVNQRVHEFGVRIALGATLGDVLRLVVGTGMRAVAVGVASGIVLALIAGRLVVSLLYGVQPRDPVVLGSVALLLLAVGVLATLAPAWRAARVDPVTALRSD